MSKDFNKIAMENLRNLDLENLRDFYCHINELVQSESEEQLYPGLVKYEDGFFSIFASADYYEEPIQFLIKMYISLIDNHVFYDGNKRSALYLFVVLLASINYGIKKGKEKEITDSVITYLEKKMTKEELTILILSNLERLEEMDESRQK
jgi:death-on-curing family protein